MDLMNLQDDIDSFQKLIFAHFRGSANNECRISALVPQVKESYGIYRFIISMLRAMYRRTESMDALEPLKERYDHQHFSLRKFYYECSNLRYLTSLINVPKLPQEPPSLIDSDDQPDLPRRPPSQQAAKVATPPARPPSAGVDIEEQRRALEEYERKQAALVAQRDADARRAKEEQERQEREFAEQQQMQAQREREAQEALERQLREQQLMGMNQGRIAELEREILGLRGQWERDQMMLERYDAVSRAGSRSRLLQVADPLTPARSASKPSRASWRMSARQFSSSSRRRTTCSSNCRTRSTCGGTSTKRSPSCTRSSGTSTSRCSASTSRCSSRPTRPRRRSTRWSAWSATSRRRTSSSPT